MCICTKVYRRYFRRYIPYRAFRYARYRLPYHTENFGTLGTALSTLPKISVFEEKYREFGRGTGTTPIPYRKSRYARYRPSYPTENLGTLGTALIPYRTSRYSTRKYRNFGRGIGTTPIPYRKSWYSRYSPPYPTENFGTLGTALHTLPSVPVPYRTHPCKIRLHGRRGKGMAESFSREKSRHAPQKEGGLKILCDLPPV